MASVSLIDTDIIVDFHRGSEKALACLHRIETNSSPAISIMTKMEMIVGCRSSKDLAVMESLLRRFAVITINPAIAQTALDLLRQYHLSHGLLIPDSVIAATGLNAQIPLFTGNQRHFRFVEGLDCRPYL